MQLRGILLHLRLRLTPAFDRAQYEMGKKGIIHQSSLKSF